MSLAFEWVARIMAAALIMVAPGVIGQWLDGRFGTSFLALVGFAIGMVAGIGCLLLMTKSIGKKKTRSASAKETDKQQSQDE